jgi:hypothetical protein
MATLPISLAASVLFVAATSAAVAAEVTSVAIERTEFVVTMADGQVLRSPDLVGATLTLVAGLRSFRFRIEGVERDPDAAKGDVWLHTFSAQTADGSWQNICGPGPDGRRQGFPIAGHALAGNGALVAAAPGEFELTCTAGARGKCIRFGYLPWADGGLDLYNTCVRMVRADYCGEGEGTTRNGMLIDLYDDVGINRPERDAGLEFEAGWSADGAVCVRHVRVEQNTSLERLVATCPRLRGRVGSMCTEESARALGAKLFNHSRP